MKAQRTIPLFAVLLVAAVALVPRALPQEGAPSVKQEPPAKQDIPPEQMQQMQEYMKLTLPAEHHKHLDYFIGEWKTTTKVFMAGPGSPPMESTGQSKFKWVLGKRFVQEEHSGSFMGQAYEGQGLMGYDNFRSLYIADWASNLSTQIIQMKGTRDPSGKFYTFYGEMDEPGLVIGRLVKYVRRIVSDDKFVFESIDLHARDDYKVVEIAYERVKK